MHTVTPRQMEVLKFIRDYHHKHGYSPTMQEIGDHLRVSRVTVFEHIVALERKGLLRRGPRHSARSLQLVDESVFPRSKRSMKFPLIGIIAAGRPIDAVEDNEVIDLEELFSQNGQMFSLRVSGESMIEEHIRDGDYVICRRCDQAQNGQTVVALLDGGEVTLKKFYREKGRVRLQPANSNFLPIYVKDVRIQGVVVGVVRRL